MSTARITELISVEDYLEGELFSQVKHEYIAGAVFAMVGTRNAHNIVASNTLIALGSRLKGKPCRPFNSDTKIRVKMPDHLRFYYPDASVVCQANPLSETFQDRPVVIVDDGEKRDAYFTIPSLEHYILLEQDAAVAVMYQRMGQRFKRQEFTRLDDSIPLPMLDISLPLRELFDGVINS
jgi:Uma2 family endonuclease